MLISATVIKTHPDGHNVRTMDTSDSPLLGILRVGDVVKIDLDSIPPENDQWYYIEIKNGFGWFRKTSYVEFEFQKKFELSPIDPPLPPDVIIPGITDGTSVEDLGKEIEIWEVLQDEVLPSLIEWKERELQIWKDLKEEILPVLLDWKRMVKQLREKENETSDLTES